MIRFSFSFRWIVAPRAGGPGKHRQQPARSAAGEVRPGGTLPPQPFLDRR